MSPRRHNDDGVADGEPRGPATAAHHPGEPGARGAEASAVPGPAAEASDQVTEAAAREAANGDLGPRATDRAGGTAAAEAQPVDVTQPVPPVDVTKPAPRVDVTEPGFGVDDDDASTEERPVVTAGEFGWGPATVAAGAYTADDGLADQIFGAARANTATETDDPRPAGRRRGSHRGPRRGTGFAVGVLGALALVVAIVGLLGSSGHGGSNDVNVPAAAQSPLTSSPQLAPTPTATVDPTTVSPTPTPPVAAAQPAARYVATPPAPRAPVAAAPPPRVMPPPAPTPTCRDFGFDPPTWVRRWWRAHGVILCRHPN